MQIKESFVFGDLRKHEQVIKSFIKLNYDNKNNKKHLEEIFDGLDDVDISHFDVKTITLLEHIKKVYAVLRTNPPLTFCQLVERSCSTNSETRRCIRILIDIGAEVEVKKRYGTKELVFILHN